MAEDSDFTYGRHLRLDRILQAQEPVSQSPDEMLFIIQHQTSELWFKLVLAEIDAARAGLCAGDLRGAGKALRRVARVLDHLVASWDVLRSLDPLDFMSFRGDLGEASGFQSVQYRLVEYALGNRVLSLRKPHEADPAALERLDAELGRASLYQAALRQVEARLGCTLPDAAFAQDRPYIRQEAVLAGWLRIYREADAFPELFDLAEQLIETEDRFRCWRFNHVTTVERVIGAKIGTGGTSGVSYLRRMLDVTFFPELWELRTQL
ncbi:tryptophan 2,3-dioxygenase family protein [Tropicimonas sp. TH_r6]|uniref:tryptophan 2,3-dioxygenase n=1 Tax=Tropicimonas sp. TH_r6 TaxID=3082085 RepID=UPI002954C457|nr:tryptophan 2,3-dioxygenase family protein [Tropicimonas sp. TH_r6]MDV7142765.1 tryptophan 2,3-dioxygenase family protein [Tropicimonas sp. TH_r6]